jgi:hypothetical protein
MDIPTLAEHYGLKLEHYTVATKEGENISVFRLPNPGKPPVLI